MKQLFIYINKAQAALETLTDEQAGRLFRRMVAYVSGNDLPTGDPVVDMAFSLFKVEIDEGCERYDRIIEKRRIAGRLGGAPKGNKNAAKTKDNESENNQNKQMVDNSSKTSNNKNKTKTKNRNKNTSNINIDDSCCLSVDTDTKQKQPSKNNHPSLNEIVEECKIKHYTFDATAFYAYYEANGWQLRKGMMMRNWRAALYAWHKNEMKTNGTAEKVSKADFSIEAYNEHMQKYDHPNAISFDEFNKRMKS